MKKTNMLKEIIVVEGRDDQAAINRAVEADTIATHGFGIRKETWDLIQRAYNERGLIIFTDPDFSGEEIRKKLNAKFPNAKNAYLGVEEATKKGNVGIENASVENIIKALDSAKYTLMEKRQEFTLEDLREHGLSGEQGAAERRTKLGKSLGIGYGNSHAFLKKLNQFGISRQEFQRRIDGE